MNISLWTAFCIVVGWSLKCIYDDITKPFVAKALGGKAVISIDPKLQHNGPTSVDVAQVVTLSTTALNLMSRWLEELQISNPRLPEECLTANQWLETALAIAEQSINQKRGQ